MTYSIDGHRMIGQRLGLLHGGQVDTGLDTVARVLIG